MIKCAVGCATLFLGAALALGNTEDATDTRLVSPTDIMPAQGNNENARWAPADYRPLKTIDGSTNDWTERPIWSGARPLDDPGYNIDVKRVHITNDRHYLYVFMVCDPSVDERFKEQPLPVKIGELLFDVDNDRTTGSTEAEMGMFGYGSGYEARVSIDVVIMADEAGRKTSRVTYRTQRLDREGLDLILEKMLDVRDPAIVILRQMARRLYIWKDVPGGYRISGDPNAKIAHDEQGVEFRIPLTMLGIVPGHSIRVMLVEEGKDFSMEGYGVRYHTLDR